MFHQNINSFVQFKPVLSGPMVFVEQKGASGLKLQLRGAWVTGALSPWVGWGRMGRDGAGWGEGPAAAPVLGVGVPRTRPLGDAAL